MIKTIVAVFGSRAEAQAVIEELFSRGFTQQDARVVSSDKYDAASVPEPESRCYAEAMRRGGTLLRVRAEDRKAERPADLMQQRGAIQVEGSASPEQEAKRDGCP